MPRDLAIIKLGGALITDKSKPYTLRANVLQRVCREISESLGPCIIVHGVGSFGHVPVIQRKLYKGFLDLKQLPDLSLTMVEVFELRTAIVQALQKAGLAPVLFLPSNMISMAKGEITHHFTEGLLLYLGIGMTVLIGGDMCADDAVGFSVCSGDKIVHLLAQLFEPKYVIFATDVAGIYTADPKLDPKAKLIPKISLSRIHEFQKLVDKAATPDITKGMQGKLEEICQFEPILQAGSQVVVLGMLKPGILTRYIKHDPTVPCTHITL